MGDKTAVITVTANQEDYKISFNEEALEKLGEHKAETIIRSLSEYVVAYGNLVERAIAFNYAKREWESVSKDGGKAAMTMSETDDSIPF